MPNRYGQLPLATETRSKDSKLCVRCKLDGTVDIVEFLPLTSEEFKTRPPASRGFLKECLIKQYPGTRPLDLPHIRDGNLKNMFSPLAPYHFLDGARGWEVDKPMIEKLINLSNELAAKASGQAKQSP
jgi:hypothetical protein